LPSFTGIRRAAFPNIFPVENLHTSDFPGDNVEYQHPLSGCQGYIPMTGTVGTTGFRPRVERGAEVVPAAASVENHQSRHLCCQSALALLFEKLLKLGCELGERVGEGQLLFFLDVHWMF
jgi:hypothetical protein